MIASADKNSKLTAQYPHRSALILPNRRGLMMGAIASLICAPAIVRITSLMAVRPYVSFDDVMKMGADEYVKFLSTYEIRFRRGAFPVALDLGFGKGWSGGLHRNYLTEVLST